MLVSTDIETLDPRHATDSVSLRATRLLHAGLVRCDPDTLAPIPYAAKGWTWLGPQTLRVELRDDVTFRSGKKLAPADVVATLRAFASKEIGSRHGRVVEAIELAREDGPGAVVITLKRPHATLLTDLELPILRADEAMSPPRPSGDLDGLGPYSVVHFTRGELELAPRAGSPLPTPARFLRLRAVHDENARALRLRAGEADVALNVLSPTLLPAMETSTLHVTSRPGANLTYLVMRVDRGPLADPAIRRAISLAIDRPLIARTLLAGRAQPAAALVAPTHWAHTSAAPLPYDVAEARRVLADKHLRLSLVTSTDRLRGAIARAVAQELGDTGVDVEVTPLELGTMLARLAAGDFEMASLQLPEMTEPNVLRVFLHSTSIPPVGANRGRVRDPEVDRLLDLGDAVTGEDARRAIYAQLEARVREMAWILPLWHEDQVAVTSVRARAFVPSAEGRWLGLAALP
jgi:peptide/nickel transport system substrate-binding protein